MTTVSIAKVREAQEGETVKWWGDERTVAPACSADSGSWYCATHEEGFRGNWMVTSHSEDGKKHVLVWVCGEHGPEASGVPS